MKTTFPSNALGKQGPESRIRTRGSPPLRSWLERIRRTPAIVIILVTTGPDVKTAQANAGEIRPMLNQHMDKYSRSIQELIKSSTESDKGIVFTAVPFDAVGRLLRVENNHIVSQCSGVMVSQASFMTAAHCLCARKDPAVEPYFTSQSCLKDEAPGFFSNYVFLPAKGLFKITSHPKINSAYRMFPEGAPVPKDTILADIAIIDLPTDIPIHPIRPITSETINRYVSVGFGMVALPDATETKVPAGTYAEGLGTLAFTQLHSCPPGYADVVCGIYESFGWSPENFSSAVCPGDSGGPLIGLTPAGTPVVVGIASQRRTQGPLNSCEARFGSASIYSRISAHTKWIMANSTGTDKHSEISTKFNCTEGLLIVQEKIAAPYRIDIANPSQIISVTASPRLGATISKFEISTQGPGLECTDFPKGAMTLQCISTSRTNLELTITGTGLAQVSACGIGN